MKRTLVSALLAAMLLASMASSVFAVGGPWEAGNSDHFRNPTPPCQNGGNPHCPPFG